MIWNVFFVVFVVLVLAAIGPVSYTHLDVYKRQAQSAGVEQKNAQAVCLCVFLCPGLEERRVHLDKGAVNWVL